ncbi:hypothetical protein PA0015 [Candidatus Phytoplasma australiense]|uniref:Uncharacterized protein n=1 Tax=Phytoplasma australiense TaxID=59748 RepID=B1V8W3_PHYAS|nr:hypothetical protein PA0015 [Candidatus Phytoplasma australiense]
MFFKLKDICFLPINEKYKHFFKKIMLYLIFYAFNVYLAIISFVVFMFLIDGVRQASCFYNFLIY